MNGTSIQLAIPISTACKTDVYNQESRNQLDFHHRSLETDQNSISYSFVIC